MLFKFFVLSKNITYNVIKKPMSDNSLHKYHDFAPNSDNKKGSQNRKLPFITISIRLQIGRFDACCYVGIFFLCLRFGMVAENYRRGSTYCPFSQPIACRKQHSFRILFSFYYRAIVSFGQLLQKLVNHKLNIDKRRLRQKLC